MSRHGFAIQQVMLKDDDPQVAEFKYKGYRSLPVVQVFNDNKLVDEWNDFNNDKIKKVIIRYGK